MKKTINTINMLFILLLLVIYAFVTYLFIGSDIDFIRYVIISVTFALIVIAYNTNIMTGLIFSALGVFGLGAYLFYSDYLVSADESRYTFFWIIVFPVSSLIAGYFSREINRIADKTEFLEQELVKLISKDELTGFDNIREFYMDLDEKMSSAKRHKYDLSLMLIEISHFEDMMAINGKAKTNEYIKLFSQLIANTVRLEDNKYRIYEDMFAIILPHTDQEGAVNLEGRMRKTFMVLRSEDKKKKEPFFGINTAVIQYSDKIKSSLDFRDIVIDQLEKNK